MRVQKTEQSEAAYRGVGDHSSDVGGSGVLCLRVLLVGGGTRVLLVAGDAGEWQGRLDHPKQQVHMHFRVRNLVESLILAQDQRWRRA